MVISMSSRDKRVKKKFQCYAFCTKVLSEFWLENI